MNAQRCRMKQQINSLKKYSFRIEFLKISLFRFRSPIFIHIPQVEFAFEVERKAEIKMLINIEMEIFV